MSTNEQNIQVLTDFHIGLGSKVESISKEVVESKALLVKIDLKLTGDPKYGEKGLIQEGIDSRNRIKDLEDKDKQRVWWVRGAVAITGYNVFTSVGAKAFMTKAAMAITSLFT